MSRIFTENEFQRLIGFYLMPGMPDQIIHLGYFYDEEGKDSDDDSNPVEIIIYNGQVVSRRDVIKKISGLLTRLDITYDLPSYNGCVSTLYALKPGDNHWTDWRDAPKTGTHQLYMMRNLT